VYADELCWVLEQVCVSLDGLTATQLRWRPDAPAPNSAGAIAAHVVAATRVYALGFGCGLPVERARDAEFRDEGLDPGGLVAALRALQREVRAALEALAPAALDQRLRPPPALWGTGEPREICRREALVEAIRHAALHLGELRLTRDLAVRHA